MTTKAKAKKPPTRIQLVTWLAHAMRYLPQNIVELRTGKEPAWVKECYAALKREGIIYKWK